MAKKATRREAPGKAAKSVRAKPAAGTKAHTKAAKKPSTRGKKKSPLTKKQLADLRGMLLAKRRALVGDMSGMADEALGSASDKGGDLSLMPDHPANIATDNFEHEFTLGLLESERALLAEIDEALARIEQRTYGVCLGTGKPINKARLRAKPWAKYCIEYARLVEKGLVRPEEEENEEAP